MHSIVIDQCNDFNLDVETSSVLEDDVLKGIRLSYKAFNFVGQGTTSRKMNLQCSVSRYFQRV